MVCDLIFGCILCNNYILSYTSRARRRWQRSFACFNLEIRTSRQTCDVCVCRTVAHFSKCNIVTEYVFVGFDVGRIDHIMYVCGCGCTMHCVPYLSKGMCLSHCVQNANFQSEKHCDERACLCVCLLCDHGACNIIVRTWVRFMLTWFLALVVPYRYTTCRSAPII